MNDLDFQSDLLIKILSQSAQYGNVEARKVAKILQQERKKVASSSVTSSFSQLDRLLDAIDNGDLELVKKIVKSQQIDLESDIGEGATLLMYAAGVGNLEIVKFLVQLGANINAQSGVDFALSNAAIEGHQEIVDYLEPLTSITLKNIAKNLTVQG